METRTYNIRNLGSRTGDQLMVGVHGGLYEVTASSAAEALDIFWSGFMGRNSPMFSKRCFQAVPA